MIEDLLVQKQGFTDEAERKELARRAFKVSSNYDVAIFNYFNEGTADLSFKYSIHRSDILRYGENPHQEGVFFGEFDEIFVRLGGKPISYNNLVDIDAAVQIMREFKDAEPTFAILKHTNTCGLASSDTLYNAWTAALACDNVSAFGGIFICNKSVDLETAKEINKLFYEVLIAPDFDSDAPKASHRKSKSIWF